MFNWDLQARATPAARKWPARPLLTRARSWGQCQCRPVRLRRPPAAARQPPAMQGPSSWDASSAWGSFNRFSGLLEGLGWGWGVGGLECDSRLLWCDGAWRLPPVGRQRHRPRPGAARPISRGIQGAARYAQFVIQTLECASGCSLAAQARQQTRLLRPFLTCAFTGLTTLPPQRRCGAPHSPTIGAMISQIAETHLGCGWKATQSGLSRVGRGVGLSQMDKLTLYQPTMGLGHSPKEAGKAATQAVRGLVTLHTRDDL